MTDWWGFFPLLMCLVLTGIHGYLGLHVLERKVIFVDLAMAQIAALGATYALWLGYDPAHHPEDGTATYLFSLGFTLAGAALFAVTRMRRERVPHEAIIGIVYASASAIAILILAKTPTGGEHIQHMLVGDLLVRATGPAVLRTALVYAGIGAFHWIFRRRFLELTLRPESASNVRRWDFLFYLSFGVVITSSVAVAGVLLVFSFLVVPATIAVLFAERISTRLWIAWGTGAVASGLGMTLSYYGDLFTGPAVVACFVAVLVVAGTVHAVRSGADFRRVAAWTAVVAAAFWGSTLLRKPEPEHRHESEFERLAKEITDFDDSRVIEAIHHLEEMRDPHAVELLTALLEREPSDRVLAHAAEALASLGDAAAVPPLLRSARRDLDSDLRVSIAEAVLTLKDPRGLPLLVDVLSSTGEPALSRRRAEESYRRWTGRPFDRRWWDERGNGLRWRASTGRYE